MHEQPDSPLRRVDWFDLPGNPEGPRQLTFMELGPSAPFAVQRVYWIHAVSAGDQRGQHAHRTTEQLAISLNGRIRLRLDDGVASSTFTLDTPTRALRIPPGLWRDIEIVDPQAVMLVLASTHFDEADYIRDYGAFQAWARGRRPLSATSR
jgi:dTDP-4-dehydrorhamnose 3,5-epimerase-like enzyme